MIRFIISFALVLCLFSPAVFADEDKIPVTKNTDAASVSLPFRADSGLTKAEGQLAEGKYMQALETLGGVMSRRPDDADALAYAGYAWYRLGEKSRAVEYLDRALKHDPRHLGANRYRADLYLEVGDFSRALEQAQVLRMVCGSGGCPELEGLQNAMNKFKAHGGEKEEPVSDPESTGESQKTDVQSNP
jgi:tetratricopeptide (TPR) repeat protein